MRTIPSIAIPLLISTALAGCEPQGDPTASYVSEGQMGTADIIEVTSNIHQSEKLGFCDFDGDRLTDMVEIHKLRPPYNKYVLFFFKGFKSNGYIDFAQEPDVIELPIWPNQSGGATKIDTADVNGDGFADVIFTQFRINRNKNYLNYAIAFNNGKKGFVAKYEQRENENETAEDRGYNETTSSILEDGIRAGLSIALPELNIPHRKTISDILRIDWGDMDGNGSDDQVLMWRSGNDLTVKVEYTEATNDTSVRFKGQREETILAFLYRGDFNALDIEDYDGNGLDDIVTYRWPENILAAWFALNDGQKFIPHQPVGAYVPEDLDTFAEISKTDTYKVDDDNRADFVLMGEIDNRPVRVVFPSLMGKKGTRPQTNRR